MTSRCVISVIVALVFLPACRQVERSSSSQEEEILEVEDVAPPIDAGITTEEDAKGPPMIAGVSGVLPGDYPRDLPTYEPSSIVDYGTSEGSWSFVDLDTPSAAAVVRSDLRRRLGSAGWSLESADGLLYASKDGVRVKILVSDVAPGSRVRVEYR